MPGREVVAFLRTVADGESRGVRPGSPEPPGGPRSTVSGGRPGRGRGRVVRKPAES